MDKIAKDFEGKGVLFYQLYTREPHAGQDLSKRSGDKRYDFSGIKQTKTNEEREILAVGQVKAFGQTRRVLIDIFGKDCVQNWLGGGAPNSLALIDREGKLVLWQTWSNAKELREKLDEMTSAN